MLLTASKLIENVNSDEIVDQTEPQLRSAINSETYSIMAFIVGQISVANGCTWPEARRDDGVVIQLDVLFQYSPTSLLEGDVVDEGL